MDTEVIDMRSSLGVARDQGPRPTCLSFALSDAHAFALAAPEPLSPDYLHFHAALRAGKKPTEGVGLTAACGALEMDGQPVERDCPYARVREPSWTPPAAATVWKRGSASESTGLRDLLERGVRERTANVLVFQVSRSFFKPDRSTHLVVEDASNDNRLHAVVVVGMRRGPDGDAFLVRNSWGPRWGLDGHAWLASPYIDTRARYVVRLVSERQAA